MNRSRALVFVSIVMIFSSVPWADSASNAPLFERSRLPGVRRADVSLDVVKQDDGEGYAKRVVKWWPKKGVDLIEAPASEPRTWTIDPKTAKDKHAWPLSLQGKKQFRAHLLGFRGIGAKDSPYSYSL